MAGLRDVSLAFALVMVVVAGVTAVRAVRFYRRLRRRALVLTDAGWWANQRDRRRLWRAVAGAEQAVAAAAAAGVPTGDLASVVRRLRAAAASCLRRWRR
jgi:Flp pilus assembly protein protease CpaA